MRYLKQNTSQCKIPMFDKSLSWCWLSRSSNQASEMTAASIMSQFVFDSFSPCSAFQISSSPESLIMWISVAFTHNVKRFHHINAQTQMALPDESRIADILTYFTVNLINISIKLSSKHTFCFAFLLSFILDASWISPYDKFLYSSICSLFYP